MLRIRLFRTNGADAATIVRSEERTPAIDDRVVSQTFLAALRRPSGIALIAGPHGSGLQATHAAIIQHVASENPNAVIAYIGSPPGYQITGSLPIYLEVGPARTSPGTRLRSQWRAKTAPRSSPSTARSRRPTALARHCALPGRRPGPRNRPWSTVLETLLHVHTLLPPAEREHW